MRPWRTQDRGRNEEERVTHRVNRLYLCHHEPQSLSLLDLPWRRDILMRSLGPGVRWDGIR
jgi:hypothetical protein